MRIPRVVKPRLASVERVLWGSDWWELEGMSNVEERSGVNHTPGQGTVRAASPNGLSQARTALQRFTGDKCH